MFASFLFGSVVVCSESLSLFASPLSLSQGYTALILAAYNGYSDIVGELLAAGANINAQNTGVSLCSVLSSLLLFCLSYLVFVLILLAVLLALLRVGLL
jgi:hypothetical protein